MSEWFKGLKYAELMGYENVCHAVMTNEFDHDSYEFINGVLDYIRHYKNTIIPLKIADASNKVDTI